MKPWNCTSEKSGKAPHPPVQETRLATPSGILYETILNSVDFGILAADTRGMVIFVNPFARSLLDFQEDISNHDVHIDAIDKDLWEEYRKIIETGKPQVNVPADANGKPLVSHRLPVRLSSRSMPMRSRPSSSPPMTASM
jgi:PAS domain-containing protein